MRAAPKPRVRACPILELPSAILDLITLYPRTADALAEAVGYSVTTVRQRLDVLEERARIHRIGHKNVGNSGTTYTWHAGLAPAAVEAPVPDAEPIELPRRFFKTKYPTIGKRDYLVAALFGQPEARP